MTRQKTDIQIEYYWDSSLGFFANSQEVSQFQKYPHWCESTYTHISVTRTGWFRTSSSSSSASFTIDSSTLNELISWDEKKRWLDAEELDSRLLGEGQRLSIPKWCISIWFFAQYTSSCFDGYSIESSTMLLSPSVSRKPNDSGWMDGSAERKI